MSPREDKTLRDELSDFKVDVERRFGRVDKMMWVLGVAIVSPKLGGPSASHLAAQIVTTLHGS